MTGACGPYNLGGSVTLAVERLSKANETANNLCKETDAEKKSSLALQRQVELLTGRLVATKGLALATVKMYMAMLGQFSGSTSGMPEEPTAFNLLSWLKTHVEKSLLLSKVLSTLVPWPQ
jgi:hypothetical protein